MGIEILKLNLLAPLFCGNDPVNPFDYSNGGGEKIFCFEIDETAYLAFEPERKFFPGELVPAGEMPPGNYLFTQVRTVLDKDKIVDLAIEVQQEGLWQRLIPGKNWYLRYLYEDNSAVTQIFRPYTQKNPVL